MDDSNVQSKESAGGLFMPSIVVSAFLTMTPSLLMGMLLIVRAGSMLTGKLVDRFWLKRLAVAFTLAMGLVLAPYMYMDDL